MAAALARHALRRAGVEPRWQAAVAPVTARAGGRRRQRPRCRDVLGERGSRECRPPRARQELTPELVEWADSILVMGTAHLAAVAAMGGEDKVALMTDFLDGEEAGTPVLDPIGAGTEVYRRTRDQLRRAVDAILDQIQPIVAP
jgi:protein-tyrosine-phosphatase